MNLVTYNLRSGGAARIHWSKVLDEFSPDIFLAQETVAPAEHLSHTVHTEMRGRVGWRSVEGRRWGSAVCVPTGKTRAIRLGDFHGHVVGLQVVETVSSWCRTPLFVFSVHAPIRGTYHRAVNEILDRLRKYARRGELVIGGDFNIGIGERHAQETRTTSNADRLVQGRLRDEFGLVNCWQEANPDRPLAQTLRWTNAPTVPYHCDGLFVPRSWMPYLRSCEVVTSAEWDRLSDHNPVVARFARTEAACLESIACA